MASSSSNSERTYHVFISFSGPDVRNTFLGHLYTALCRAGIDTFIDEEGLKKGEPIIPGIMKAIDDSRIAVIIFSENYASSSWRLDELTKIMECREQNRLIVLPVFYRVEPRELRTLRQSYGEAMAKYEPWKDSEKVNRWKKALSDASALSGWHFIDGNEAELVREIVLKISTQLELKTILNLRSKDDILKMRFYLVLVSLLTNIRIKS